MDIKKVALSLFVSASLSASGCLIRYEATISFLIKNEN